MDSNMAPSPPSAKPGAETALPGRRSRAPRRLGRDAALRQRPHVQVGPAQEGLAREGSPLAPRPVALPSRPESSSAGSARAAE